MNNSLNKVDYMVKLIFFLLIIVNYIHAGGIEVKHAEDCAENELYLRSHTLADHDPKAAIKLLQSIADKNIHDPNFCSDAAQQMAEYLLYQANECLDESANKVMLDAAHGYIQKCDMRKHEDTFRLLLLELVLRKEYTRAMSYLIDYNQYTATIRYHLPLLELQNEYNKEKEQQLLQLLHIDDNPIIHAQQERKRIIATVSQQVASAFVRGLIELRNGQ